MKRKGTVIEDIREFVEKNLAQMLANNPLRMNYEKKYQEVIAAYNADKDRTTVEETFARLLDLANGLDEEQRRAVELGLAEVEVFILDHVYQALPEPPYTTEDKEEVAKLVYRHIWQQSASGWFGSSPTTAETS